MGADYISRAVMDKYFDKFQRKLDRLNVRIVNLTMRMKTMEQVDLFNYCHICGRLAHLQDCDTADIKEFQGGY